MPRCPVCRVNHPEGTISCNICGLSNISPYFINYEDAKKWEESIEFTRNMWLYDVKGKMAEYLPNYRLTPEERSIVQLDSMFNYSDLVSSIETNKNDFVSRSTLIDCLHQAYVYRHTFRTSSSQYVKKVLREHISFFKNFPDKENRRIQLLNCAMLPMLAEIEIADCNFSEAVRLYCEYILQLLTINPLYTKEDEEHQILHNIIEISKLVMVDGRLMRQLSTLYDNYYAEYEKKCGQDHAIKLSALNDKLRNGKIAMHNHNCGLINPEYYTDKTAMMYLQSERDLYECTYNKCVFEFHSQLLYSGFADGPDTIMNGILEKDGLIRQIEYVSDDFSISEAIYLHRDAIEGFSASFLRKYIEITAC